MRTRNVVLTEHQAKLIENFIASGRYQNESEVLREGLRLIESREAEEKIRIAALLQAAKSGIADIEAGRYIAFDSPNELKNHLTPLGEKVLSVKLHLNLNQPTCRIAFSPDTVTGDLGMSSQDVS